MRVTVQTLKQIISEEASRLVEHVCPTCGDADAYIGATSVDCPNPACDHFSQEQLKDMLDAGKIDPNDVEMYCDKEDPRGPQFGHSGCGADFPSACICGNKDSWTFSKKKLSSVR